MTDLPIQKVLKKPDVAGRMVKWAVELSEFDIKYEPRGSIKGQVFADFVVELSSEVAQNAEGDFRWVLSVDGSSNHQQCLAEWSWQHALLKCIYQHFLIFGRRSDHLRPKAI